MKNFEELRKQQKEEAIKRMKTLKIMPNVIEDFKNNNIIYYSENMGGAMAGILFWITNNPEYVEVVERLEARTDGLVYHAELSHTRDGDLLSLLYVSSDPEEWEYDQEDLNEEIQYCYVANITDPILSDFGTIYIKPCNGGVKRY